LAVEKIFSTLGLGTQEGHLQKGAVSAATATGADELDPVFKLGDGAFEPGPIYPLEEPSSGLVEGGLRGEG